MRNTYYCNKIIWWLNKQDTVLEYGKNQGKAITIIIYVSFYEINWSNIKIVTKQISADGMGEN